MVTYPDLSIIVVDNGSRDGSADVLRGHCDDAQLLALDTNLGYTGGNNAGIRKALAGGAEIVGVLNNDTVVEPGFLEPLVQRIEADRRVFASPTIMYLDNPEAVWFQGSYVDPRVGIVYHGPPGPVVASDGAADACSTIAVTGCCFLAHRTLWDRVGFFDDDFFLIFEDSDWSARARALGGIGVVVTGSTIRHAVSASLASEHSPIGSYYYARNGLLYLSRHGDARIRHSLVFVARLLRESVRGLVRCPNRSSVAAFQAQLAGVAAFVAGRRGKREQR
jgi:GT2 family glycosyltransferase